jgi:hypothetical protein
MLEAHAGSLLWLIKAKPCFLSRAQSVNGFKREKLNFNFHSEVMDRTIRMKMRRGPFIKEAEALGRKQSSRSFLKEPQVLLAIGCCGIGDRLRFPQWHH